jgi:hypothetical protein
MLAVHTTRVRPSSIRHDPSAEPMKFGVMLTGRNSPACRPSCRRDLVIPTVYPPRCGE